MLSGVVLVVLLAEEKTLFLVSVCWLFIYLFSHEEMCSLFTSKQASECSLLSVVCSETK